MLPPAVVHALTPNIDTNNGIHKPINCNILSRAHVTAENIGERLPSLRHKVIERET